MGQTTANVTILHSFLSLPLLLVPLIEMEFSKFFSRRFGGQGREEKGKGMVGKPGAGL